MKDKRIVTDFRHLYMRIARNNFIYPLLKDTFLVLGSSQCEVLSLLDLKDAFHSLQLSDISKKNLWNFTIYWQCIISISKNAYGIKYLTINLAMIHEFNFRLFRK